MIVKMVQMRLPNFVKANIVNVPSQNSDVEMANVSQVVGGVIMKTIVVMAQMKSLVKTSNVKMEHSSVLLDIVLHLISVVMVIETVETCQMS